MSKHDTNVGIITYSGDAAVRYGFENITNQTELENALDTLTINGSGRNIGEALDLARTDLFNQSNEGRNGTRNILIVVTDGGSDDNLPVPTQALKRDGVTIFSIGIDGYVLDQLNEMASDPDSEHVFTIDFYDELGPTMAPLKDAIIRGLYGRSVSVKQQVTKLISDLIAHSITMAFPIIVAQGQIKASHI